MKASAFFVTVTRKLPVLRSADEAVFLTVITELLYTAFGLFAGLSLPLGVPSSTTVSLEVVNTTLAGSIFVFLPLVSRTKPLSYTS